MPTRKRTTWFFVADRSKARLIESSGVKGDWTLIREWSEEDARRPSRDLGRDRPVRGRTIGTGEPFAVEGVSEQEKAAETFLVARADDLNKANAAGRFDQLVIAAPPSALGILRKKLHPDLTAKLIGVFDKGLANESDHALREYFMETLELW